MSQIDDDTLDRPSLTEEVARFETLAAADLAVGLLAGEMVRARVDPSGALAHLSSEFRVYVAPGQGHRARWVLRDSDLTDAELTYLATGEFGTSEDQ